MNTNRIRKLPRSTRLFSQALEDRLAPAVLVLQQGADNGFGVYSGAVERRVDGLAGTGTDGSTVQNNFIDSSMNSSNQPNPASADQQDLLLFSDLFGNNPGQIPLGSIINSATLTYTTSTVGNADSPGPIGVTRMLVGWDQNSTHASLGLGTGAYVAGVTSRPSGAFQSGTFAHSAGEVADCNVADIVQAWSNGASNFGFNVRCINTDNGWSVQMIGNTNVALRPKLTVDYTPTTGAVNLASFQQGVASYADTFDIWLQQNDTTTDGSTITGYQFLDGTSITAPTSPTDSMLLKFSNIFGPNPGQVPTNANILRATLAITSGAVSTASESNGPYGVAQMLVPFDVNSKYTTFLSGDGPTAADGEIGPIASTFAGMVDASRVAFNVTGMVNNWRTGQDNHGILVGAVGIDDGWAVQFTGSTEIDAHPQLQIYWQPGETVPPPGTLDIVSGALDFNALAGVNNVDVAVAAGVYTISDSQVITLTQAAKDAGWSGSGTTKVTGPDASVSSLVIRLGDSADSFTLTSVNDALTVFAGNSVGDAAVVKSSTNVSGLLRLTEFDTIATDAGVVLGADSVTLDAFSTLGSSTTPIATKANSLDINSGKGGAFIQEADGANLKVVTATALTVTNLKGEIVIVADSGAASGGVTISSADGLTVNTLLATVGTMTLSANTDGAGTEGLAIGPAGSILASDVVTITVNTAGGGTGNAVVGSINTANASTISVDANAGSVLSANNGPLIAGGGTTNGTILLRSTGTGSVGLTGARISLQTANISVESGSGGIFIDEGSASPGFVHKAVASGAGDIYIQTLSADNNGLLVDGPVTTGSGNITLIADDDFQLRVGGTIGGAGFSGKVFVDANRDAGNAQLAKMEVGTSIETTNTSADAVTFGVNARTTTVVGGAILGNIKVGAGGGILINVAHATATAGLIVMNDPAAILDAGPTGTITMKTHENAIGLPGQPIRMVAGTVIASTTSTTSTASPLQDAGYVYLQTAGAASFTASTTTAGTRIGTIDIETLAGDLTLGGSITTTDGAITLKTPANIGQTGGIVSTVGTVTLNYVGTATFTTNGNTAGDVVLPAGQNLTVNGSLKSGTSFNIDATLRGTGTVIAPVNIAATGKVAPGASPGALGTGNLVLVAGSQVEIELNGFAPGTGYDQLVVTGTVDLGGATLVPSLGFVPPSGSKYVIVDNDGADAVTGQFSGFAEGATVKIGSTDFTISYKGGDGNDVVLTAPGVAAPAAKVASVKIDDGSSQRSMIRSLVITFDQAVTLPGTPETAFELKRQSDAATVTLSANVDNTGPTTVVTLTFTGGAVNFNSLQNGRYTLTIAGDQVSNVNGLLDGNGDGTGGDDYVLASAPSPAAPTNIWRLFGDADGDNDVDTTDFAQFRLVYGSTGPSIFDFDNDGDVDTTDFGNFRSNFGSSI